MSAFNKVIERPEIRSIGAYDFPSRSAQALYGDDQLVNVWYDGNPWFVAAACFRAPKAMSFGDFWSVLHVPYHQEDPHRVAYRAPPPDWVASWTPADFEWGLDDAPWTPEDGATLESLGVGHKSVIRMVKK